MRTTIVRTAAAALAVAGAVALASPASAAPNGPSDHASCVGQVFVPQATGDPRAIALRIAEIKPWSEDPWGQVVSDLLAHWDGCKGE
ncbi:hypothetical protein N798_03080 [Knoellia flava TL1]|uniref:Uncharacterized protein n=2 Tax=Knoellia flava TaxID=913969 RepID=A0A8H9KS90_9MICO|nr:hypothetical protein [Knoellia flava]KGN35318.1 hypothetical protein N798_03080 [Knoellia flava TL1]GGB78387.1 hypothetical protein GCM10011314_17600 [Knoellia flava]